MSNAANAKEIQARAVEWLLERRDCENWSVENQAQLDAWLAESPAHVVAYWRAEDGWKRTELLSAFRPSPPLERVTGIARVRRNFGRVGAALAIAVLGIAAGYYYLGTREQVYATAIGGHQWITLADGSRVELNTDTVLRAQFGNGKRLVTLDKGEAYFQVRHDAAHPFIVTVAHHRVTDLGTKFLVRNDTNHLEVALLEGRASFEAADAPDGARPTVLLPGDVIVATQNAIYRKKKSVKAVTNELGWQHGVLVFDDTALGDAANELNRYNRKKLIIADAAAARLTIVGTFPVNDVELVIEAAKDVYGLRVKDEKDEAIISR